VAKHFVKKGGTNRVEYVWILDSGSAVGAGKTGIAYNTASLTAYYVRRAGSPVAITLATQTVTGAFSSGGFVEVDATNMPGLYRLDVPDAAFATGVNKVIVLLKGAAGMAPVVLEYQLVDFDPESAADLGLTNLDATVSSRLATAGYTAPPTATANADALLNRDMAAVSDTESRSPLNAFRFIRNGFSIAGSTLTVLKEDDTTAAFTRDLATDASADPIVGVS
jgi:hypothetical protein